MHRASPRPTPALLAVPMLLSVLHAAAAPGAALAFREQSLELPGAPAVLIPGDLDDDGLQDLAVAVIYTEWDQIGIEEHTEMDQVEGLVEVLTIVPTLMDRREVRVYRGRPDGRFELAAEPLPLPLDVLSLEAGPPGVPVLALTDAGASALRLDRTGGGTGTLRFEPLVEEPPVLAGTGTFLAGLDLVRDATGDGVADLLLPAPHGVAIYPGRALSAGGGLAPRPLARVPYFADPDEAAAGERGLRRDVPLPTVLDADGDGLPDLLFRAPGSGLDGARIALQTAPGRFAAPAEIPSPEGREGGERAWIGPVDRFPGAELVVVDSLDDDEDAGVRESMRQVREPRFRVRVHPLDAEEGALTPAAEPSRTFEVKGWVTSGGGDSDFVLPGGFQDLSGDGRSDLVTVTNDISLFKAVGVLATRRLSLELGFLAWCQQPDGGFVRAPGEPLTSELTIRLDDLEIRHRSLFAGDFDGDGRHDFLQLGGSSETREVGIHRGRADCSYPERPDHTIRLRAELRDLALARILDLNGDGRDDLAITHPLPVDEAGVSPPVRLDLYTSASTEEDAR